MSTRGVPDLLLAVAFSLPAAVGATVLDFEDLPTPEVPFNRISDGYGGLEWRTPDAAIGFIAVDRVQPSGLTGWFNGVGCDAFPPSGSRCTGAINSDDGLSRYRVTAITASPPQVGGDPIPFNLVGADWTSTQGNQTLTFTGMRLGNAVFSRSEDLSETRRQIVFSWASIDRLVIRQATPNADYWLMDNLQYLPIPEPGTSALLIVGMGVMAWGIGRRRTG